MTAPTQTLKGFAPVQADKRGAPIDREDLRDGVIVKHVGTRWVDGQSARGFIHTFKTRGGRGDGQLFECWGTSELNDMLKKTKAGAIVFLRYGGKEPHPELPGAEVHRWDVRAARHSELTPELNEAVRDNADAQVALEAKIVASKARERERFEQRQRDAQSRGDAAPPHTDDDLPL